MFKGEPFNTLKGDWKTLKYVATYLNGVLLLMMTCPFMKCQMSWPE